MTETGKVLETGTVEFSSDVRDSVGVRTWRKHRDEAPYLSWCFVVRNSKLDLLENALKSCRERAPDSEIVVVETMGSNSAEILALAQKHADVFEQYRGPDGSWNEEMYAVTDMAAARQRSFDLASGRWRAWVDDDDTVVGGEEARVLLEKNGQWRPPARSGQKVEHDDGRVITIEDLLRHLESSLPEATMVWSPYLYMKDDQGHALQWSWRERFARWDDPKRFRWAEPAHEILVPREGYLPPRVELPHILWVHHKKWDRQAYEFSLKRHSAIILKQYEAGDVTFRRCRYLAAWAAELPSLGLGHRELEFLERALAVAFTWLDRYRAHVALGLYYARRGLSWDAKDHFAAAQVISPGLPDAWYAEGQTAMDREDWGTAVTSLRRGIECKLSPESEVNPREHAVTWPSKLSIALQRLGVAYREAGDHNAAVASFQEGKDFAFKVLGRKEVGSDALEANALFCRAENASLSEHVVTSLYRAWQHLRRNDESQKALGVVALLPHDQAHHPLAIEMETWGRVVAKHVRDQKAYSAFYNDQMETGWVPLVLEQTTYERAHPRAKWAIGWIKKNAPSANVLDVGCCDGIVGLPLLEQVPGIAYYGVDVGGAHLDNFAKLLGERGAKVEWSPQKTMASADGRVILERGVLPSDGLFDVVLLGEIVEHVPDPVAWLEGIIIRHLKPGGVILLSTPWGSFDDGHPPEKTSHGTPRDERGHLRAYSAWQLAREIREAGGRVESIEHIPTGYGGDAMCAVIRHELWREEPPTLAERVAPAGLVVHGKQERARPVAVYVAGALWNWNGSKVDREGIGASEEMIVRMGEKLAGERDYDVFGPTPEEEVFRGVGYFPKAAIRKAPENAVLLVSRSPASIKRIDQWSGCERDAVLHLQDTRYPDLTPEVAVRYRTIVCVSDWHAELTARDTFGEHSWRQEAWPKQEGGSGRIRRVYNWLDRSHFQAGIDTGWQGVKQPFHFVYASSPDRGVVKLLELWPRVLDICPQATLAIFYGWKGAARLGTGMDSHWNKRYLESRRRYEALRHQKGIQEFGMVNHYQLALEYQKASVWAYPTDFHETGCLSACKARAAGAVPVTSALAALNETAACLQGTLVDRIGLDGRHQEGYDEAWLEGVKKALAVSVEERQTMARKAVEDFSWEAVKDAWAEILS